MDIKTLESFKLSDAVKFHEELNPKLWIKDKLNPQVKKQLKLISDDFITELGISGLDVKDITISGSNAAYTYTKHSDIDLHILVDMDQLPNSEVYKELFKAKKTLYNDTHDITVNGIPVELYVQDSNEPVISLGEYSILNDKWLRIPTKRRANFDQTNTKSKYEKLLDVVRSALKIKDEDKLRKILEKIRRYRQAGLDQGGEFSPENLAFKMLRSQGYISKLYKSLNNLHSKKLSTEQVNNELYEYVKGTETKEHLTKRALFVAEMAEKLGNRPLLFREFKTNLPKNSVLVKVVNDKGMQAVKAGSNPLAQLKILQLLDITNPVFCVENPPTSTYGFHGNPHIVIPPHETEIYWSPVVHDLGTQTIIKDGQIVNLGTKQISKYMTSTTPNAMLPDSEMYAKTYKKGYPKTPTSNEIILDTEYYYLLNIELFVSQFSEEEMKKMIAKDPRRPASSAPIDPNLWTKIKTYSQLAWYIKNVFMKFVENPIDTNTVKENTLNKPTPTVNDLIKKHKVSREYILDQLLKGIQVETEHTNDENKAREIALDHLGEDPDYYTKLSKIGLEEKVINTEDQTMQFSSEKTPAINPYGGLKDNQFRGAINEMPDTSGPVGVQPGGWRTYKPRTVKESVKVTNNFWSEPTIKFKNLNEEIQYTVNLKTDWRKKIELLEVLGYQKTINEELDKEVIQEVKSLINNFASQNLKIGKKYIPVPITVLHEKIMFHDVENNYPAQVDAKFGVLTNFDNQQATLKIDNKNYTYPFIEAKTNVLVTVILVESESVYEKLRTYVNLKFETNLPNISSEVYESASGYIPSEKEKNDPRYCMALTVDIKSDTMKKDAKKFGNKISRAGIPPTLNPNGKF